MTTLQNWLLLTSSIMWIISHVHIINLEHWYVVITWYCQTNKIQFKEVYFMIRTPILTHLPKKGRTASDSLVWSNCLISTRTKNNANRKKKTTKKEIIIFACVNLSHTDIKHKKVKAQDFNLHCKERVHGMTELPVAQFMCYNSHNLFLVFTLPNNYTHQRSPCK